MLHPHALSVLRWHLKQSMWVGLQLSQSAGSKVLWNKESMNSGLGFEDPVIEWVARIQVMACSTPLHCYVSLWLEIAVV